MAAVVVNFGFWEPKINDQGLQKICKEIGEKLNIYQGKNHQIFFLTITFTNIYMYGQYSFLVNTLAISLDLENLKKYLKTI